MNFKQCLNFWLILGVLISVIVSSCSDTVNEAYSRFESIEDSTKSIYGIEGEIKVLELINYPDSIEFAAFLRLNLTQGIIDEAFDRDTALLEDFEIYKQLQKEIVCKSPDDFPNFLKDFKDWYVPVGFYNGKITFSNYCEFMPIWQVNDTAIIQPGMDGSLIYPLINVGGTFKHYKLDAFDPLSNNTAVFELYETEYHHTYILREKLEAVSNYTLVSKYSDLKFHQFIDYRCDEITSDKFLKYPNLDSIKIRTDDGLKYFGQVRPCDIIKTNRDTLESPFRNVGKVTVFSFYDQSVVGKKQKKDEIFNLNSLQRNNVKDSIHLTTEQIKKLNSLFYNIEFNCPKDFNRIDDQLNYAEPDCVYYPHHLIAVYDLNGNIKDYLEVCFMCDMWNTSIGHPNVNECELQYFLKEVGVQYGLFPHPCD